MRNDYEFYNSISSESEEPMKPGDLIKLEAYARVPSGWYEPVEELKKTSLAGYTDDGKQGVMELKTKIVLLVKKYQPDNRRWERTYWAEDIATGEEWMLQPKESQAFSYTGNKTTEDGSIKTEWNPADYWMRVRL